MKRLVGLLTVLVLLSVLVPTKVQARRTILNAASCSRSDVEARIIEAVDGDTVQIPSGSCTWTTTLFINKSISLVGNGVGITVITAQVPDIGGNVPHLIHWTTKSTGGIPAGYTRLAGMTVDGGTVGVQGCCEPALIHFAGNTANLVVQNVHVEQRRQEAFRFDGYIRGVVSEVSVNQRDFGAAFRVDHTTWGNFTSNGYGGAGDGSWSAPTTLGTVDTLVFEDVTVTNFNGPGFQFAVDGWNGMRYVVRKSTFIDTTVGNHGTESGGRERGARQFEYYKNTYISDETAISGVSATRGGTGIVFDNAASSIAPNGFISLVFVMDTDRAEYPPPHPPGAYYPWYLCGTIGLSSITRSGNIATATSTANHYMAGGQGPPAGHVEVRGATDPLYNGEFEIISASGTTFTYAMSGTPAANASGSLIMRSPYDQNSDTSGVLCLDQVGAGKQDHTFGAGMGGTDVPNGLPWNTQNLEPVYIWNNTNGGSLQHSAEANGGDVMIENVHYYDQNVSFTGATGVGRGTIASRPGTCTTGVGYWATDEGEWDSDNGATPDGRLYKCTSTNTWTLFYTPLQYPHPLLDGEAPAAPIAIISGPTSSDTYDTQTNTVTVTGNASDDVAVTGVTYSSDRGANGSCSGTTSFTCSSISLSTGINIITVTATDGTLTGQDVINVLYLAANDTDSDNFDRGNWSTLGPWWTHQGTTPSYAISNNFAIGVGNNFECSFWNQEVYSNDQFSQAVVGFRADTTNAVRVAVRSSGTGSSLDAYFLSTDGLSGDGHTFIGKFVDGALSTLQAISTTVTASDTIKLSVTGTTLKAYKNDVQIGTDQATGGEITTGSPGICFYGANSSFNSWSGGDQEGGEPPPPDPTRPRLRIRGGE